MKYLATFEVGMERGWNGSLRGSLLMTGTQGIGDLDTEYLKLSRY